MSDINLSSAVRTSLISLQGTADLLSSTQERLATGNRVNSALDDPTAFFTASALGNRASDLSTLLDAQQQAIRTVEAADQGITAIEDLVDSARAQATAALQTDDASVRATAAAAFDDILSQIEDLAGDASFNGTNLLQGDDLQVIFNEGGSSSLTVEGFNFADASSLGLSRQGESQSSAANLATADLAATETLTINSGEAGDADVAIDLSTVARAAVTGEAATDTVALSSLNEGDVLSFSTDGGTTSIDVTVGATADPAVLATQIQDDLAAAGATGFTFSQDGTDLTITSADSDFTATQSARTEAESTAVDASSTGFADGDTITFNIGGADIDLVLTDPSATSISDQINASTDLQAAGISASGANGALVVASDTADVTLEAGGSTVIDTGNSVASATAFEAATDATAADIADSSDEDNGGNAFVATVTERSFDAAGIADAINEAFGAEGDVSAAVGSDGNIVLSSSTGNVTANDGSADGADGAVNATGTGFTAGGSSFATDTDINSTLASIDSALSTLRSAAASLGSDLSTVQIRQDFTSNLINTLEAGAGDLTLADLNEEGANLLTLQTRQQLASTSLSFATQSDSSVLSLF